MTDYYTKGETRRLVGKRGLVRLGDPDKVEQRADGNVAKLYAVERVNVIVAELDAEREQAQIAEATRLDHVRRFGTAWEKLEAGLPVDLDLHFGDGWRFQYKGDNWDGYFQLYRNDELLMDGHDEFYEAIEYLVFNAAKEKRRARVWLYPPISHEVVYDYQIGDWELVVALARECVENSPEEAERMRRLAQRYPVPDDRIWYNCEDLDACDWYIQHRDGFRATGYEDDDNYDVALLRVLFEIAAYEDATP